MSDPATQMSFFDGDDRILGALNRDLRRKNQGQKPRIVDQMDNPVGTKCPKCLAHIDRGDAIHKIAIHRSAKGVWVCGLCAAHHRERTTTNE